MDKAQIAHDLALIVVKNLSFSRAEMISSFGAETSTSDYMDIAKIVTGDYNEVFSQIFDAL